MTTTFCSNPACIYAEKSKMTDISKFPDYVQCGFCKGTSYCSNRCRIRDW